jgi:hypothetical protein
VHDWDMARAKESNFLGASLLNIRQFLGESVDARYVNQKTYTSQC